MEVNKATDKSPATPSALDNRVIIMNGFADSEVMNIMRAVKALCRPGPNGEPRVLEADSGDLIFAKTTPSSIQMVLADLITDMSEDHAWLKANPPPRKPAPGNPGA